MKKAKRFSNRFRQQLKEELQIWESDNIVNPSQSALIIQKYKLDQLTQEKTSLLIMAIYIIGAVLIGAGAISFVAANWENLPAVFKIIIITAAMLASHSLGFYFWKISGRRTLLGHALIVLGTLIFGANIGLLAQILHIKADFYNGLFAWSMGALIMAYAVHSIPNAIIGMIVSFVGFCFLAEDNPNYCFYYPIIAAVGFLPFAYLARSLLAFVLSLLAAGLSTVIYSVIIAEESAPGFLVSLVFVWLCTGIALASYRNSEFKFFASGALLIAHLSAVIPSYLLSFIEIAEDADPAQSETFLWITPVIAIFLIGAGLCALCIKTLSSGKKILIECLTLLITSISVLLLLASKGFLHYDYFVLVIASNITCFAISASLIINSSIAEDRRLFWSGILLAAIVIFSRFMEYETSLLTKAIAFVACGIALIVAGVKFESYLRKRRFINE